MQRLGGIILVESEVGKGTTFIVEIPIKCRISLRRNYGMLQTKVLLVDDEVEFASALAERLQLRNYDVKAVYNALEALDLFTVINLMW